MHAWKRKRPATWRKISFPLTMRLCCERHFPRAYSIAIVANDTAFTDITFSMFGNKKRNHATPRFLCSGGEKPWRVERQSR